MKEVLRKDWEYILYEEEQTLKLSVLMGTIALYDLIIVLNAEETKKYREEGQSFLDELAEEIRNQPNKYQNREHHSS